MGIHSRWIQMCFILMLQFTVSGALSGGLSLSFTVRDGDKVTLPCESLINNHHSCDTTTWIFSNSKGTQAVELVNVGQITKTAKSDRLSVTAGCSLDIKNVTAEDVGRYTCRQFTGSSGTQQGPDAEVHLSVVITTEQKDGDKVTLSCSVQVNDQCKHKVKWSHNSDNLDRDYTNVKTSESSCSATVTFINSVYISSSDFKCRVTEDNKEQLFTFSPQSSDTASTTALYPDVPGAGPLWLYILGVVILVAIIIAAVKLIWLKRFKGNKTQANGNSGLTLNPAVTPCAPETSQETLDHEDGVSYASVSYTNKTHSKNKVWGKNSDESETVTYATVKASSTDPSSLYATIK